MTCAFCNQNIEALVEIGGGRTLSFIRCATCGDYDVSPDVVARMASDLYLKQRLALQVKEATQQGKIFVAAVDLRSTSVTIERLDHVVARPGEPPPEPPPGTRPLKSED